MLAEELGELDGLDGCRAHAGNLIGGYGHAEAGSAEQDAAVELAARPGAAHLVGIIGIIDGFGREGPEVDNLVAERPDKCRDLILLAVSAVI